MDIEQIIIDAPWAACSTHHTLFGSPPVAAIFGCSSIPGGLKGNKVQASMVGQWSIWQKMQNASIMIINTLSQCINIRRLMPYLNLIGWHTLVETFAYIQIGVINNASTHGGMQSSQIRCLLVISYSIFCYVFKIFYHCYAYQSHSWVPFFGPKRFFLMPPLLWIITLLFEGQVCWASPQACLVVAHDVICWHCIDWRGLQVRAFIMLCHHIYTHCYTCM